MKVLARDSAGRSSFLGLPQISSETLGRHLNVLCLSFPLDNGNNNSFVCLVQLDCKLSEAKTASYCVFSTKRGPVLTKAFMCYCDTKNSYQ